MEQIETQVSDLRYLAQAPVAAAALNEAANHAAGASSASPYETPQRQRQGMSPGSASLGDNSAQQHFDRTPGDDGSGKRKSIDDGGRERQTRSKRNRYISIACNECKRRKIKCNGETPCQRCGNLNLVCAYAPNCCSGNFKDSQEFREVSSQLERLQNEVGWLNQAVKAMQTDPSRALPLDNRIMRAPSPSNTPGSQGNNNIPSQSMPLARGNTFRGTTSMAYSLDVANSTMSNMGYESISNVDDTGHHLMEDSTLAVADASYDPLSEFDSDEMIRLCRLHEEEVGIMYPVLNIQSVIAHARIYGTVNDPHRGYRQLHHVDDEKTMQLKIVMCCALAVEEHGQSDKAVRIYGSMEAAVNRKLMDDPSNVADLPLLALAAGYRFLSNDEILAWRVMGHVVRLCLELGIHQKRGLRGIKDETERRNALMSFWSAYVLDRRWAFGTGLPYSVQDDEIDPQLPSPDEYPYLVAMITYSRIGAKVWRQISHFGPVLARELRQEELERLDQEILQWYETVPDEVKIRGWDKEKQATSTPSYNLQRLRIWTYLRLNQIRIWLYTPTLHSATSIMYNPVQAQRVVDLAKDTICYLSHLNKTTNLYRRLQVFYHQFLTSAIAVVFLASVHAPVRFSAVCREEFYLALDLVQDLSAKSWVSKRLWKTIRSLKDVAPRFGLNPDDDRHSSAALGMIGLARGHVNRSSAAAPPGFPPSMGPGPMAGPPPQEGQVTHNGSKIQTEMSKIFEGYVGLNGFQGVTNLDEQMSHPNSETPSPESAVGLYGGDATVFPHLREMF